MSSAYYDQPMVVRLRAIFGDPVAPQKITQRPLSRYENLLEEIAEKAWHEIRVPEDSHYLTDLCYSDLQQDLFDYLFPAFLNLWREGQISRQGGSGGEVDIYRAIDSGELLNKMMQPDRQDQVVRWMADAYLEGVDAWSHYLSVDVGSNKPFDLHGPLESFHALGQSVPVTEVILAELTNVSTVGRAQWWLVFASGILWTVNQCPYIPAWNSMSGGGGVYILSSETCIYEHGYLPENLEAMKRIVTVDRLIEVLEDSVNVMPDWPHGEWAQTTLWECCSQRERIAVRLENLMVLLSLGNLGGLVMDPLDNVDECVRLDRERKNSRTPGMRVALGPVFSFLYWLLLKLKRK